MNIHKFNSMFKTKQLYSTFSVPHIYNLFKITILQSVWGFDGYFQKGERLVSLKRLRRRDFINFICEKLLSTEAVATGIDRLMIARVFKLGNILFSISFVANLQLQLHVLFRLLSHELTEGFPFCADVRGDHCFFYCFLTMQRLCRYVCAIVGKKSANCVFSIMG